MSKFLDLLGDPIPANHGGRGRPAHIPTQQNANRVMMLAAFGWDDGRIAAAIGITPPTLRKHYFSQLKRREEARPRVEMKLLEALLDKANGGSVPANREFVRRMHEADLSAGRAAFARTSRDDGKADKRGKKELALDAAQSAGAGTDWGDDLLGGLH